MNLERPSVLDLEPDSPERQELHRIAGDVLESEASLEAAKASMPEWFLPPVVIVKMMRTARDHEYADYRSSSEKDPFPQEVSDAEIDADFKQRFECEKEVYERLKPIRGSAVPLCYGEGSYGDQRALVFCHYDGTTLDFAYHLEEDIPDLEETVAEPVRAITEYGIIHQDLEVQNVLLLDIGNGRYRAMLLDFEYSTIQDDLIWDESTEMSVQLCCGTYTHWRGLVLNQRRRDRMTPAEKRAELARREEISRINAELARRELVESAKAAWLCIPGLTDV